MESFDISRVLELGVVGTAFMLMLRWMMTRFERELRDLRAGQQETSTTIAALSVVIVSLQKQLLAHDLTVHGINPSTGGDTNERANRAIKKYTELRHVLDETATTLSRLIK